MIEKDATLTLAQYKFLKIELYLQNLKLVAIKEGERLFDPIRLKS